MRKNVKRVIAGVMAGMLMFQCPNIALADSEKVVTLGADLTSQEREAMLQYFGVTEDEVLIIEVNNQEERAYLKGIATEAQIGTRTYSCAYIMPTNAKKINVRTAHLTWVSTSMIANTLVTAGIDSCDVIAAAPKDVSGTGALTGIIKAYEKVTEETLDEEKTELAMEELFETAELGNFIGQEEASAVMNEVKTQVLKDGLTNEAEINEVVEQVASYYDVELTEEQSAQVSALMARIGSQDYDYEQIESTMEDLQDKLVENMDGIKESFKNAQDGGSGFFAAIGEFFSNLFASIGEFFSNLFAGAEEESILDRIDESALGIEPTADAGAQGNVETEEIQETEKPVEESQVSVEPEVTQEPVAEVTEVPVQEDSFIVDENQNVVEEQSSVTEAPVQEEIVTEQ